jgi:phosphatidylglycerophosphate synthase
LNDYWNWVVEFVPLWVAPNVLTALGRCSFSSSVIVSSQAYAGFLSQLVGFVAMSYYNPDFETPVAPWVYFLCAGGLFAYQTLDNIDGKQARRTKSSSPLGELFDHVSDAMGVGTMITTVGASCRVGPVVTLSKA